MGAIRRAHAHQRLCFWKLSETEFPDFRYKKYEYTLKRLIMIVTNENITSKQRSKLKSIAANLSPVTQIGKGGITDNLLKTLSDALDAHEIIKVNILETADEDPKNLAENVAELLEAVPVAVIGRKAIFYRYSRREKFAHLEF